MERRPRIKLNLTQFDKLLETGGTVLLILMWALTLVNYLNSPAIVPVHYDLSGNADKYGSKLTLLFLPVIPTVILWGLTQINRYPHVFNYVTKITEENAERQYTIATRLIRILKVSVVLIFTVIMVIAFLTTLGIIKGPGIWLLPITVALFVLPTIFAVYLSLKKTNKVA